jgi:hypothetical protein
MLKSGVITHDAWQTAKVGKLRWIFHVLFEKGCTNMFEDQEQDEKAAAKQS